MKKSLALLVLLVLVMGLAASAQIKFKDVPDNHWAAPAVYDLVKLGITKGYPDGTFRGTQQITRYETAVFLQKMANSIDKKIVSREEIQRMIKAGGVSSGPVGTGAPLSALIYARYQKGLSNSTIINNFDITRAYLTLQGSISDNASGKVILDSTRGGSTGMLETFLKCAYVDLNNVLEKGIIPGTTVNARIGLQPTYWSGWVDGYLGLRVVAASLQSDRGLLTTADFGVGLLGSLDLIGFKTNYVVTGLNGTGFTAAETNSAKDVGIKLDSEVMPGLTVGVGAHAANIDQNGTGSKQANLLVGYKADNYKTYLEALYGLGGLGISVAGLYDVTDVVGLFGRVDQWDPNRSVSDDQTTNLWAGVTYDWNSNVMLVGDLMSSTVGTGNASLVGTLRTQISL
ncbi:MAG: S-layer homology domain-containing protein [Candidatus Margulisbacteria bacterium]|nr:S-layer homology domain-containing protein [Candidatus Margulisiibacteriota bacterium]